jgi:O-acetyl-ADP-ribose deacetylase (regulator of RNase III)
MKLILYGINPKLLEEFRNQFSQFPTVEILDCDFANLPKCDCIVSPANSFGLMDGGIDGVFTEYFGKQLMERVQKYIIENYAGEQPVGTSFVIETRDINKKHMYLAHTPTMSVPRNIQKTANVYYAMKAMLQEVAKLDYPNTKPISVACCGLGTGCGMLQPKYAVGQMREAYENFLNPPQSINWKYANVRHFQVDRWRMI